MCPKQLALGAQCLLALACNPTIVKQSIYQMLQSAERKVLTVSILDSLGISMLCYQGWLAWLSQQHAEDRRAFGEPQKVLMHQYAQVRRRPRQELVWSGLQLRLRLLVLVLER